MKKEEGQHWRQFVIAIVATFANASIGYAGGWPSPVESKLSDVAQSPLPRPITREEAARIGSLITVGAIFGPFIGGIAASRIGRKWALMMGSVPLFSGWLLLAAATDIPMMYAARVLFGVALGIILTVVPIYNGEIAEKEVRGALGSFLSISLPVGILISYSVGPFVTYSGTTYVGVSLCAIFAICFYFMPESPYFFLLKEDRDSARESLMTIRGKSGIGVEKELNQLSEEVAAAVTVKVKFSDLWATRGNIKALYISAGLLSLQPFTGITALQTYTESIFRAADVELDPAISSILFALAQVLGSMITPFVVDRLGRRLLLMGSSLGMVVTLGVLGLYFILDSNENPIASSIGFVPVVAMVLHIIIYSLGIGPIPWALLGELFSIEVKAISAPIAITLHWTMSFLVSRYFYSVVDSLGMHYAFWIFSAASLVCFVFTFFLVPETKGKTFTEIQDVLNGRESSEKLNAET